LGVEIYLYLKGLHIGSYGRDLNYIVPPVYERESIYRKIWEHKSLNIGT